ncbi:MAG: peptide MFS transporter, partial [Pirellulaceae bacterium]|nr:peptide MFS transporter [Pirellulaceae bacterium]
MSQAATGANTAARRKHPKGLWVLFIVEMWERYAFYTMQALLVLYLIKRVTAGSPPGPGFGWDDRQAQLACGLFMGLTYLTPIAGGWLADKWLGTHRSMMFGGFVIALGQFCLAGAQFFSFDGLTKVTLADGPGPFLAFFGGLLLIIIGCGFFKPCAAVMVGQL